MEAQNIWASLAVKDWNNHIPCLEQRERDSLPLCRDLNRLEKLVSALCDHINHEGISEDIQIVINKCWNFSISLPKCSTILKACRLCEKLKVKSSQPSIVTEELTLCFPESEQLILPGYYRKALAAKSEFFKLLLEGGYKESYANTLYLEVPKPIFLTLIDSIEDTYVLNPHEDINSLFEIAVYAHKLRLEGFLKKFNERVIVFIRELDLNSDEDQAYAIQLQDNLSEMGIAITDTVKMEFAVFFGRCLHQNVLTPILFPKIKYLSIFWLSTQTLLCNMTALETLIIDQPSSIEVLFQQFKNLNAPLKELQINCNCKQSAILQLLSLMGAMSLKVLSLKNASSLLFEDDNQLKSLQLQSFTLTAASIQDDQLKRLNPTHLNTLSIPYCSKITDEGIAHFKDCNLIVLNLSGTKITDQTLKLIQHMPIRDLNLSGCEITDAGLEYLASMSSLKILNISNNCKITDKGFSFLNILPLKELRMYACPKISKIAQDELFRVNPNIKFYIDETSEL